MRAGKKRTVVLGRREVYVEYSEEGGKNEMIHRKPEKKCLERQEVGKEDTKHVMGTTPRPPFLPGPPPKKKQLKTGALFKGKENTGWKQGVRNLPITREVTEDEVIARQRHRRLSVD